MGTGHTEGSVQQEGARAHHMHCVTGEETPGSQSARSGWFSCVAAPREPCSPACSLLLLKHVRTSSLFLGPLCSHWCKLTAALGRQCVRAGALHAAEASSPSYRAWVCLKQGAALLGPRVLPDHSHPFFTPRFTRGPVRRGRWGAWPVRRETGQVQEERRRGSGLLGHGSSE